MNRSIVFVLSILSLVGLSACSSAGLAGGDILAEGIARDMIYGSEFDETSSAAEPASSMKSVVESVVLDATVVRYGAISGTATISRNISATELAEGSTAYNGSYTFTGERDISFNNYSNVANRTIQGGSILVEISEGLFESSTLSGLDPLQDEKVTRTVTGVEKRISGALSVIVREREHACTLDLAVSVERRVIEWTYDSSGTPPLVDPQVKERVVQISGVVTIDGVAYLIDRQISTSAQE
jgi:hypothetical protein